MDLVHRHLCDVVYLFLGFENRSAVRVLLLHRNVEGLTVFILLMIAVFVEELGVYELAVLIGYKGRNKIAILILLVVVRLEAYAA